MAVRNDKSPNVCIVAITKGSPTYVAQGSSFGHCMSSVSYISKQWIQKNVLHMIYMYAEVRTMKELQSDFALRPWDIWEIGEKIPRIYGFPYLAMISPCTRRREMNVTLLRGVANSSHMAPPPIPTTPVKVRTAITVAVKCSGKWTREELLYWTRILHAERDQSLEDAVVYWTTILHG